MKSGLMVLGKRKMGAQLLKMRLRSAGDPVPIGVGNSGILVRVSRHPEGVAKYGRGGDPASGNEGQVFSKRIGEGPTESDLFGGRKNLEVGFDGLRQSHFQGIANEGMTDGNFKDLWDRDELAEVGQIQVMSRIDSQPKVPGNFRGFRIFLKDRICAVIPMGGGVRLCVEFNAVCPNTLGPFDGIWIRIHKKGHSDAQVVEFLHNWKQAIPLLLKVPAVIGCECGRIVRYQGRLCGLDLSYNVQKPGKWVSFDVVFDAVYDFCEIVDILFSNVALIRSGMDRNALASRVNTRLRQV